MAAGEPANSSCIVAGHGNFELIRYSKLLISDPFSIEAEFDVLI